MKEYFYKKQENGRDSWRVMDDVTGEIYMTFDPPSRDVATWKIKAILDSMGLLPNISAAINSLPEPNKTFANYAWEYSQTVDQYSPTVKLIQTACGLTNEQMNVIFDNADKIKF